MPQPEPGFPDWALLEWAMFTAPPGDTLAGETLERTLRAVRRLQDPAAAADDEQFEDPELERLRLEHLRLEAEMLGPLLHPRANGSDRPQP